jgi:hypothetical protein
MCKKSFTLICLKTFGITALPTNAFQCILIDKEPSVFHLVFVSLLKGPFYFYFQEMFFDGL